MNVIYICYFSISEHLVQTQVIPYLKELSHNEFDILLLTYEPELRDERTKIKLQEQEKLLKDHNITLKYLKYHKAPTHLATLYDIITGFIFVLKTHQQKPIKLLHARSHIPMIIALLLKTIIRCKVLFDIRGLLGDEYVDAKIWKKDSFTYRIFKLVENVGFVYSDSLVVLTQKMRQHLVEVLKVNPAKISVIPCCVASSNLFRSTSQNIKVKTNSFSTQFNLVYAGSVSGLYLVEELLEFYRTVATIIPQAKLTILTHQNKHKHISDLIITKGLSESSCTIKEVEPKLVVDYMKTCTVGLSFRKPTFSQIAASPTKIPEYLMAGIPVVSNYGIGDTDLILQNNRVGIVFDTFNKSSYINATHQLLDLLRDPYLGERCRQIASEYFDLKAIGGSRYNLIYKKFSTREITDPV